MPRSFDVIVIGIGAMGSSACWHLARRGASVLGLEQFDIPNAMGSSHGESRMIRLCYYEHPDYVPLLRRAYELWRELESRSGQTLLHLTGGLYMGPAASEFITGTLLAARKHQLPHDLLDGEAIRTRYPQFHLRDDDVGIFEPNAGFLLPEAIISAQAELALRSGAVIHAREPVRDWSVERESVIVRTDRGTYVAKHLVICAGPWSGALMQRNPGAGSSASPLTVTRQTLAWLWPRRPSLFEMDRLPVWAIGHDDGTLHYGFPMLKGGASRPGVKIAHHARGPAVDPDRIDGATTAADESSLREAIRRFVPEADGPILSMRVCMYTSTPDSHFIIDRLPGRDRATIACGFSGHGFKFASVVGEILADLALDGRTSHPIAFLGAARFG
jgi:sarcosine oxidase